MLSKSQTSKLCFIIFGSDPSQPCTYCEYAKALLENMSYEFVYVAIELKNPKHRALFAGMLKAYDANVGDRITIPQIFCITSEEYDLLKNASIPQAFEHLTSYTNRKYIGGFDVLVQFIHANHVQ